jgi:hypothetical protein
MKVNCVVNPPPPENAPKYTFLVVYSTVDQIMWCFAISDSVTPQAAITVIALVELHCKSCKTLSGIDSNATR